jgi:transposase
VRIERIFQKLLRLQGARVQGVTTEDGTLVLKIERKFRRLTCPRCGWKGRGRESAHLRRWRHLALWGTEVALEGEIRRFRCRRCEAVVTEAVPWARHDSDFTRPFEDAVALLAQQTNRTAVAKLTGVAWITVGRIAERLVAEKLNPDRTKNLRRIGIDEISFRKRHKYLTIVTDHDTGTVVWAAEGKSSETLAAFFRLLGPEGCAAIEIATIDMSDAYEKAIKEHLPNAKIAFDHFHIAKLANEALNQVRRELQRQAEEADRPAVKGTRWALLHRFENVPEKHAEVLEQIRPESPLGRAYLLKEALLDILRSRRSEESALKDWLGWATRSRVQPFVRLGRTIRSHFDGVVAFMKERMTNGLAEGMNNKIRLLSHRAYGFHSAASLIATIYLCCAGITLPNLQLI